MRWGKHAHSLKWFNAKETLSIAESIRAIIEIKVLPHLFVFFIFEGITIVSSPDPYTLRIWVWHLESQVLVHCGM